MSEARMEIPGDAILFRAIDPDYFDSASGEIEEVAFAYPYPISVLWSRFAEPNDLAVVDRFRGWLCAQGAAGCARMARRASDPSVETDVIHAPTKQAAHSHIISIIDGVPASKKDVMRLAEWGIRGQIASCFSVIPSFRVGVDGEDKSSSSP